MKRLAIAALMLANAAYAQQPGVQPTPEAQALAQKLMGEINANIQCSAANIMLQQRLTAAEAKIKELEAKMLKPAEAK